MNIIFRPHFFGGKNNNFDETFVPLSLKSVLKYNPDSTIYFISNDQHFIKKHFPLNAPDNLKCFVFQDFEDENTRIFDKNYVHLSHNPLLFEKYSILGYLSMYHLMSKFNIDNAIIVETDVLVFCNLSEKFANYYDINNNDAILADSNTICCSYIRKIYLETFTNTALKMYSDEKFLQCFKNIYNNMKEGGICDMTINDWINNGTIYGGIFTNINSEKKKIKITELSNILSDHSFFDNYLSKINYENNLFDSEVHEKPNVGKIKKIYTINNEPYFKYNDLLIKCNSMHFQGPRKEIIPEIYTRFISY